MYSGISWEDNEGGGGVISLTTVDNKKGSRGFSFVFSVCVYVCMFGRDGVMC